MVKFLRLIFQLTALLALLAGRLRDLKDNFLNHKDNIKLSIKKIKYVRAVIMLKTGLDYSKVVYYSLQ